MQNKPEKSRQASNVARDGELKKLHLLMRQLKRNRFGYTLEQTDYNLFQLGLEDLTQNIAATEIDQMVLGGRGIKQHHRICEPFVKSESLPIHLLQTDSITREEDKVLPHCGGLPYAAGEAAAEFVNVTTSAQPSVKRVHHCRYGRAHGKEAMVQEAMLKNNINNLATEELLAYVLTKKYAENLPLYRQVHNLRREGIESDFSVLSHLVGRTCYFLRPLYERLLKNVLDSPKIFVDRVDISVLDPRRARKEPGKIWAYAVDNRPWGGTGTLAVVYIYRGDRDTEPPYLANFNGILQVDRRSYFRRIFEKYDSEHVRLALCWARCRQRFIEVYEVTNSCIIADVLGYITELYAIEEQINGLSAEIRKSIRQAQSQPVLESLHMWLREQLNQLPRNSPLANLISYVLDGWEDFTLFLDDGRVEIDNNTIERLIRPIALSRKNSCLAGFGGGAQQWTVVASLIQSAKLNGIEPMAYLYDVLERITTCFRDTDRLDLLLPWTWKTCAAHQLLSREIKPFS